MSKQQEMIEQLQSKSNINCLEAMNALFGVQSDEVLSGLLRIMMSEQTTIWTDLEKTKHPKVEAYKAAIEIATTEMLRLALVDRKFPEVRSGAAYLLGESCKNDDQKKSYNPFEMPLQDPDPRTRIKRCVHLDSYEHWIFRKYYHS